MDRPSNEEQDRNRLIPETQTLRRHVCIPAKPHWCMNLHWGDFGLWMYEQSRGYTVRLFGTWTFNQRGVSGPVGYAQARLIYDQLIHYDFSITTVLPFQVFPSLHRTHPSRVLFHLLNPSKLLNAQYRHPAPLRVVNSSNVPTHFYLYLGPGPLGMTSTKERHPLLSCSNSTLTRLTEVIP